LVDILDGLMNCGTNVRKSFEEKGELSSEVLKVEAVGTDLGGKNHQLNSKVKIILRIFFSVFAGGRRKNDCFSCTTEGKCDPLPPIFILFFNVHF
jgi:hypothetical protein